MKGASSSSMRSWHGFVEPFFYDVGTGECGQGVVDPVGIKTSQVSSLAEDHLDGPLAPVGRPVVGSGMLYGRFLHEWSSGAGPGRSATSASSTAVADPSALAPWPSPQSKENSCLAVRTPGRRRPFAAPTIPGHLGRSEWERETKFVCEH